MAGLTSPDVKNPPTISLDTLGTFDPSEPICHDTAYDIGRTQWKGIRSGDVFAREQADVYMTQPGLEHPPISVVNGAFTYFDVPYKLSDSHERPLQGQEIAVGVVCLYDGARPAGLINLLDSSQKRDDEVAIEPLSKIFGLVHSPETITDESGIAEFLRDYPSFFSRTNGDFNNATHLSDKMNTSVIPIETKYKLYQLLKGNISSTENQQIGEFFKQYGEIGTIMFGPAKNPTETSRIIKYALQTELHLVQEHIQEVYAWLDLTSPQTLGGLRDEMGSIARPPESYQYQNVLAEALAWTAEVDGFGADMSVAINRKFHGADKYDGLVDQTMRSVRHNTNKLVGEFINYLDKLPNGTKPSQPVLRYISDAIRSQKILISLLSYEGQDRLTPEFLDSLKLPPFFFKLYRELEGDAMLADRPITDIMNLWFYKYGNDLQSRSSEEELVEIRAAYEEADEFLAKAPTTEKEKEIAKQKAIWIKIGVPKIVKAIDWGSGRGDRVDAERLSFWQTELGANVEHFVGVDVTPYSNTIPQMEFHNKTIIQMGQDEAFRGFATNATSDWSSSVFGSWRTQLLQFGAFNLTLQKGGVLALEFAFPEGEGSYEPLIEQFKNDHPNQGEGSIDVSLTGDVKTRNSLYFVEAICSLVEETGFRPMNVPEGRTLRQYLLTAVKDDDAQDRTLEEPFWRTSTGKPRVLLALEKVKDLRETTNPHLLPLFTKVFALS